MLKSLLKDSFIYTVPALLSRGLAFFLFPLYTQVLSPKDYGAFDILTVFGNIITLTVALEISQAVARFYTEERDPSQKILYASTSFWFSLICYLTFLLFTMFFAYPISGLLLNNTDWSNLVRLYALYICLYGMFGLIQNQFRWEFRSKIFAVVSMLVTIISSSVAVYLAYFLEWGIYGIFYGLIFGCFIGCVYGLWNLRETYLFKFDFLILKKMIKFSAPLIPSSIAVFFSLYLDRIMINHYLSLEEVGIYGIGYRLASIVGLLMVGFKGALTPLIYANYKNENAPAEIARIFRYFCVAAFVIFLILSTLSKEILLILTTPQYTPAAEVVIYLIPTIFFTNMFMFAPGITISKKTHFLIYLNIGGAIINFILNYILIPMMGITGAGIATLLSTISVFIAYMTISQRLFHIPHNYKPLILSFLFVLAISYVGINIDVDLTYNFIYKMLLILFGILVIFLMKIITRKEILFLLSAARNKFYL